MGSPTSTELFLKNCTRHLHRLSGKPQIKYWLYAPLQPGREFRLFDAPFFRQVFHPDDADWVIIMNNTNYPALAEKDIWVLNNTRKPVLLLERCDSTPVWFRQFHELDNLKLVFKNTNFRDLSWNNKPLYHYRWHLDLIRQSFGIPESVVEEMPDGSDGIGHGVLHPLLRPEDLAKVHTLAWDHYCSPFFCEEQTDLSPLEPVPFSERSYDIFCVSSPKRGILGQFRIKLKEEVDRIGKKHNLKTITTPLKAADFHKELRKSRISVSAPGWGEHVLADWHAALSNVALFKPDCGYVNMNPDLYSEDHIYFFDYSLRNLEEKILELLENYPAQQNKITGTKDLLRNARYKDNQEKAFELMCQATA